MRSENSHDKWYINSTVVYDLPPRVPENLLKTAELELTFWRGF